MEQPSTPPRRTRASTRVVASPPTPEVTRRIEENRLKAKALRDQHEAAQRAASAPTLSRTSSGFIASVNVRIPQQAQQSQQQSRKRGHDDVSGGGGADGPSTTSTSGPATTTRASGRILSGKHVALPSTSRDGRLHNAASTASDAVKPGEAEGAIRPARKFTKFVDYDFGKMVDTKGGFLATEDDPWNKAMSGSVATGSNAPLGGPPGVPHDSNDPSQQEQRPSGMSLRDWERLQLLRKLRRAKAGPFEPGLSALKDKEERKKCRECGGFEIDFVWEEVFGLAVCGACKEKVPEKYSLLTKTECKDDYLLTDPELRDDELLPHLSKPNPHKSHWHDMMLFLRCQVEEYAFSDKKWGSTEALDAEFERREADKKKRKEAKFKEKLLDLKKRTRTDAYRRQAGKLGGIGGGGSGGGKGRAAGAGGKEAKFGDVVGNGGKHVHEWGRVIENEDGATVKTCSVCGMEVEEMEF
ncbi:DNA-repair protein [Microdochium nivale]|nr:DNA-repair protein [Microdochium nivale]